MIAERVLVVGGAGFIGANLAHRLLSSGTRVRLLDSLARPGVERNLAWLRATHGDRLEVITGDVRDPGAVARAVEGASAVFHLAAQVAVTTSLVDPVQDFEVNARGTLNVLEAVRRQDPPPFVLFTSTNKVYGALEDVLLEDAGRRYAPVDPGLHRGISEARNLAFHSPYGCSKGAAEQYVLDWARTYGVPATVFRMSCIYGPHQFGTEDQGWVAHFLIQAMARRPITLYGDGKQVRDILFVEDLLDAFLAARERPREVAGRAFNLGGGPDNTVSLIELLELVEALEGVRPRVTLEPWRLADQRWYVSDPSAFAALAGWAPRTGVQEGVGRLHAWLAAAARPQRPATLEEAAT
ncbi:NAD-dependent epimerase/dehydratase [Anaeromyxobacter sp. K]|uniref:SDR family NAD(P)-dependent oxidoreductase n=1 Tax=Anaeromyxobacter sp. (strain K) TaxID=447217 RepID=UPI00015F932D|nr:SDR family NAD(P)-dependent oxidoreductase [Anaeromyxobacter sp. K]ACG72353.1 NAD-dependent epimerase/dehydratase [Anaeromyxobacter sp. K]